MTVTKNLKLKYNEEVKAVKKYTCSKVYTVNGDKCEKYNEKPAKVKYTE